jgi:hypothetical protein
MAGTSSNHCAPRPCEVCSPIAPNLMANTGRGETLAPELGRLVRLDLDSSNDLYACPDCEALFEWEDLPQYYGSGNNDEERLTRLTPEQASTTRALLDPDPGESDGGRLIEQAFRVLSHGIVYSILRYRAVRHERAFSRFVAPLVARLMVENNGALSGVISSYCANDLERLTQVLRLFATGGPELR